MMIDKNGIEMETGDIVKIENAYFKNDNGYYFITHTPGDPSWLGGDYGLNKIGKRGKISTARGRVAFWPLASFCSDMRKNIEADMHNKEHATIEIIDTIDNSYVIEYFEKEAGDAFETAKRLGWNWGETHKETLRYKQVAEFYEGVADRIRRD
jgi:hypothetical protein